MLCLGTMPAMPSLLASDGSEDGRLRADGSDAESLHAMALAAEQGRDGVKDETRARELYRKAAELGYARSRHWLGLMLLSGRGGPKDETEAARLFQQAALQDFGPSQASYGQMLAEGRGGLIPNPVEAAAWLSLSADNGLSPDYRDQVLTRLSAEQRAVLPQRVSELSRQISLRKRIQRSNVSEVATVAASTPLKPAPQTDTVVDLKAQIDALNQTLAQRQREADELRKDLEVSKQAAAAALAAQAAAVQALPDAQAAHLEIETLQGQIAQLEARNDEQGKRNASELAALAAQLTGAKETIRSLSEANQAFTKARDVDDSTVKAQTDALQVKITEANAALEKTKTEREELRARLIESDQALERQAASVAELTQSNEKALADRHLMEEQVRKLRPALEKAGTDLAEMKARLEAQDTLAQKQAEQLTELSRLNDKLSAEATKREAELTALREEKTRLAQLGASLPELQKELEALRQHAAEGDKALEQQGASVAELTQLSEQLKADKASLQTQLQALSTQVQDLGSQAEESRQRVAQAQAEARRVTDQAATTDREQQARIASLLQENASLGARLRQAQGTLEQIAANASNARVGSTASGQGLYSPVRPGSITLPTPAPAAVQPAAAPVRVHTVAEGDSLSRISLQYYGTASRWQEIYDANRNLLKGEKALRPGQKLRIP